MCSFLEKLNMQYSDPVKSHLGLLGRRARPYGMNIDFSTIRAGLAAKPPCRLPGNKKVLQKLPALPRNPLSQPPASMSTDSSASAHAASAKNIANYTQSISSGVTNLLTEIGRVSATTTAPASTTGTDGAILLQLQALTGQIVGLANRMDDVQRLVQGLEKRLDDLTCGPCDTGRELENDYHFSNSRQGSLFTPLWGQIVDERVTAGNITPLRVCTTGGLRGVVQSLFHCTIPGVTPSWAFHKT